MKSSHLYIVERIDIFCPAYTEYLWDIIAIIKNDNKYISDDLLKDFTLDYVREMIDKDIICIGNEWITNHTLKCWELSKEEIIDRIDKMWFKDAKYPDFLEIVWFNFKDWYINALNKKRMIHATNWQAFVKENIGDLEQWIEENRPKE